MSFGQELDDLVRVFRPHFCRPNSDRVVPFALRHLDFWRWELALHCGREALPLVSIWPGGGNLVAGIRLRRHANAISLFWGVIIEKWHGNPGSYSKIWRGLTKSAGLRSVAARALEYDPKTVTNYKDRQERLQEFADTRWADVSSRSEQAAQPPKDSG